MTAESRVREFFRPGGTLSRAHRGYEPRPSQLDMALDVLETLQEGGHLVVEAGTGVGKTLAYLVPAIVLGRRVIVSTATRTLQDQLGRKDLPFLAERCGLRFSTCTIKGRDNYLCLHRFAQFRQTPAFATREEAAAWPSVVSWAEGALVGDVAELSGLPENPSFWAQINARNATCLGSRCPQHDDCFLQEVRRQAHASDVIIVNHHLYLADAVVRASEFGEVLPDADAVIFDEAHALEDAATSFFARTVSSWRLRDLAEDTLRELTRGGVTPPAAVQTRIGRLHEAAGAFAPPWGQPAGRTPLPARLTTAQQDALERALAAVRGLAAAFEAWPRPPALLDTLARRCRELADDIERLAHRDDPTWVHWLEVRGRNAMLTAAPVDVSSLLRERVFARLRASVLCSATLAVGGVMDHVRQRLGLAGKTEAGEALAVRESTHASPFDHARQGLLYLAEDLPEPRDPAFAAACAATMRALVSASRGRAFLLFTSFDNLGKVHAILADDLPFPLLVQGSAPKAELLRRFREQEGSVLFATHSFWQGVDVPGPALSLVAIDKLPFAVPSDPIVAARGRLVEDAGGNAFLDLAVPEAVLALKQGLGRLIRSRSDRGVAAVLDPRLLRTRYGSVFLSDLPPFPKTTRMEDVIAFFEDERLVPDEPP